MKTILIDEDVHKEMDVWRAKRGMRTFNDAVKQLLSQADETTKNAEDEENVR